MDEFDDDEDEAADPKPAVANDNEDDEDDEDLDEDEFVVEKIFSHYIADDVRFSMQDPLPPTLIVLTIWAGQTTVRSQMGRLGKEIGSHMGT